MPRTAQTDDIRIGTIVGPDVNAIRHILPHGFESFSIMFWQALNGCDLKSLSSQVHDTLAGHDIKISTLSIFGNPLGCEPIDEETRQSWKTCIEQARLFGCDLVTGFTGRILNQPIERSLDRFVEVFGPIAKQAHDAGVRLAFENCPSIWNMATFPHYWEMLFDALPMENIGLEWEPCHQRVALIDPLPQIRKYGRRFFHIHGKDAAVRHDVIREHGIVGPIPFAFHRTAGFGDSNWTDIISELRMIGYTGCIDIEGWHDPVYRDDLEMTGQVHALNYLKQCRGGDFVPNPA